MIGRCILLAAAAAAGMAARPAAAQQPLRDVPSRHWASGAVGELHLRGIITGYPDGTFGGKRAVTRYEFALVGQRVLQDVQCRIDAAPAPSRGSAPPAAAPSPGGASASPLATREQVDQRVQRLQTSVSQLRVDVDALKETMSQLRARAAALRTEVDQMRQQLGGTRERVSHLRPSRALIGEPGR